MTKSKKGVIGIHIRLNQTTFLVSIWNPTKELVNWPSRNLQDMPANKTARGLVGGARANACSGGAPRAAWTSTTISREFELAVGTYATYCTGKKGVARRMGKVGSPYRTRTQSNSSAASEYHVLSRPTRISIDINRPQTTQITTMNVSPLPPRRGWYVLLWRLRRITPSR